MLFMSKLPINVAFDILFCMLLCTLEEGFFSSKENDGRCFPLL